MPVNYFDKIPGMRQTCIQINTNMAKFTPPVSGRARKAFTLIEILVVIAIIAVLAAMTTRVADSITQSQDRSKAAADMAAMAAALETFKSMYNDYPRLNANAGGTTFARDLYKCLSGKSFMRLNGGQITFVDMESAGDYKPLLDITVMRVGDPADPDREVNDFDNPKLVFLDPWGNPYLYFYDSSLMAGAVGAWEAASFILLSRGPDGKDVGVNSMYSNGIMPSDEDYRKPIENADNIVYGLDN